MHLQMPQTRGRASRAAEPETVFDETGLQVGHGLRRLSILQPSTDALTCMLSVPPCLSCSSSSVSAVDFTNFLSCLSNTFSFKVCSVAVKPSLSFSWRKYLPVVVWSVWFVFLNLSFYVVLNAQTWLNLKVMLLYFAAKLHLMISVVLVQLQYFFLFMNNNCLITRLSIYGLIDKMNAKHTLSGRAEQTQGGCTKYKDTEEIIELHS